MIVGSVDGNRLWGKELDMGLQNVEWSPDGRRLIVWQFSYSALRNLRLVLLNSTYLLFIGQYGARPSFNFERSAVIWDVTRTR